jgi:glycine/D-amino acid oxidase-like deaminating enzyme
MSDSEDRRGSVWLAEAPRTAFPALEQSRGCDVAVVGGGIVGLTSALLLARTGMRVTIIEAGRIGCGVTGASTAKVTSLHGARYASIEGKFGEDGARTYAAANEAGLAQMAAFAREFADAGNDCRFERKTACTFTSDAASVESLREEAKAARRAGLPAAFTTELDLPFRIEGAVQLADQAQLDPYRYCLALADACTGAGVEIFESSRVHEVAADGEERICRLVAGGAEVRAAHVVVATLLPFLDRGGYFARTSPSRSYGIAVTLDGPVPDGMYIGVESPTRSLRPLPGGQGMIVVGEEHKVGQDPDTRERYAALEAWAGRHFPVRSVDHRWSAQDYLSADQVPYVGRIPGTGSRVLTATGFGKWGLSSGTAAAMILNDLIGGRENPWAAFFDATRVDVLASARKLVEENANVAKRFVGDRLRSLSAPGLEELAPGEGGIVRDDGVRVAAYRDEAGNVHTCSPICTHMGCFVQWNAAEKSWDCPCHGSRFGYRGDVLQGPAVHPLELKRRP